MARLCIEAAVYGFVPCIADAVNCDNFFAQSVYGFRFYKGSEFAFFLSLTQYWQYRIFIYTTIDRISIKYQNTVRISMKKKCVCTT